MIFDVASLVSSLPFCYLTERGEGGGELGEGELSEQASGSRPRSSEGGPDGSPEAEDSEGENEDEEDVEDEEGDDDDDDDDEDEEDDDDEEEEEEEEEDEEDEESEEEGEDVESEGEGEEEEEEDKSAASVLDESIGIKAEHSGTGDLDLIGDGGQNEPENCFSDIKVTESGVERVGLPDNEKVCSEAEGVRETGSPGIPNYGMPANLDIAGDCVVSAIRVESMFSDEDESMQSADPNIQLGEGATGGITPSHSPATLLAAQNVELVQEDNGDGEDWSLTSKGHSGEGSWKDSDDDALGNKEAVEHGRNTVLSQQSHVSVEEMREEKSETSDSKIPLAKEQRRCSSWGSSIHSEGSDQEQGPPDLNGPGGESEVVPAQSASPIQNEESLWDSSPPPEAPSKCHSPKSELGKPTCSVDSPLQSCPDLKQRRPESKPKESKSEWDSSSDDDEDDLKKDPSFTEDAELNEERVTYDVSPLVSPEPQDQERPTSQALDGNVEVITMSPEAKECLGNQNDHDEDNSWDDGEDHANNEVERPVSPTQNRSNSSPQTNEEELGVNSPLLKLGQDEDDGQDEADRPDEDVKSGSATQRNSLSPIVTPAGVLHKSDGDKEDDYEGDESPPVSMIEGNDSDEDFSGDPEDPLFGTNKGSPKPEEDSENSDSRAKQLRYDFASATVQGAAACGGDDSDSTLGEGSDDEGPRDAHEVCEPRLTSYAPLAGEGDLTCGNIAGPGDHTDRDREKVDPRGYASAQVRSAAESDRHGFSDEELPTTDIDDVDVDSPHEEEHSIKGSPRIGKTANLVQVQLTVSCERQQLVVFFSLTSLCSRNAVDYANLLNVNTVYWSV